jgi:hypothetical protein
MPPATLELLKILGAFIGAVVGGVGALFFKMWLDWRQARARERQTRWLPLLGAARDLKARLEELDAIYRREPPKEPWDDHTWEDAAKATHRLPSKARDFHELYLLDGNPVPIRSFQELAADPDARRRDDRAVQPVRTRIHELNYATSSLYRTARYLGYAYHVRRELEHGQLRIAKRARGEVIARLWSVRTELNGTSVSNPGAGIIDDLQDLIGEIVWGQDDRVISYHEFRERLLRAPGWEQFTDLLRFFVHFHYKMDYEVKKTREALAELSSVLEGVIER